MSLSVIKRERTEQEKLVELELKDLLKEVTKSGVIGYVLIHVTSDDMFVAMNLMPQEIRQVIGFIETDVKPTLTELVT